MYKVLKRLNENMFEDFGDFEDLESAKLMKLMVEKFLNYNQVDVYEERNEEDNGID